MKIVARQLDIVWENKPANFERVRQLLAKSPPVKNSLVVLPEMFATGFTMNAQLAEPDGGETEQFLGRTAKEFGVCLMAGAPMRGDDGRVRNKALIFEPGGNLLASYAKIQPFRLGGELDHFTAGDQPVTFEWQRCKVSPFVCYDLRFPEIFRVSALAHQPHLFVVIANWPEKRIHHWMRLLQARAIENQSFVVGVNRCGTDPYHIYSGGSVIVDPHGEILADAGRGEALIEADLNLDELIQYRQGLPFLADIRLDFVRGAHKQGAV